MVALEEEPPLGTSDLIHVRVRLPDGERVSRRFTLTQQMEVRYFVYTSSMNIYSFLHSGFVLFCWSSNSC